MPQRQVRIANKLGLHARPASKLVQVAQRYPCEVFIAKDGMRVNAKSIMGVLMLAAGPGSVLSIQTEGEQAEEALDALVALIERKFDEE